MMKEENTNVQVTEPVRKTGISFVSLMVEDLRHRKWMLVLSSVVQLLMGPFATIFILSRYHNWYNISDHEMLVRQALDSVDSLYRSYLGALAVAVALCGALIVVRKRSASVSSSIPAGQTIDALCQSVMSEPSFR